MSNFQRSFEAIEYTASEGINTLLGYTYKDVEALDKVTES
jgi:hypothetical protein